MARTTRATSIRQYKRLVNARVAADSRPALTSGRFARTDLPLDERENKWLDRRTGTAAALTSAPSACETISRRR